MSGTLLLPHRLPHMLRGLDASAAVDAAGFDGATYATRGAGLTGAADSKLLTLSFWLRSTALGTSRRLLFGSSAVGGSSSRGVFILIQTDETVQIGLRNAAATVIFQWQTFPVIWASEGYAHILISVDLENATRRHFYINNRPVGRLITTYTDDTVDFTIADWGWGATPGGLLPLTGDSSEFWMAPGVYIDFSQITNRRKFITSSNEPADLGSDGSKPTGTAPLVYLADTVTNKGTGGDFAIIAGALTAPTSPSD